MRPHNLPSSPFALISLVAVTTYLAAERLTGLQSRLLLGVIAGLASAAGGVLLLAFSSGERLTLTLYPLGLIATTGFAGAVSGVVFGLLGAMLYNVGISLVERWTGKVGESTS